MPWAGQGDAQGQAAAGPGSQRFRGSQGHCSRPTWKERSLSAHHGQERQEADASTFLRTQAIQQANRTRAPMDRTGSEMAETLVAHFPAAAGVAGAEAETLAQKSHRSFCPGASGTGWLKTIFRSGPDDLDSARDPGPDRF